MCILKFWRINNSKIERVTEMGIKTILEEGGQLKTHHVSQLTYLGT